MSNDQIELYDIIQKQNEHKIQTIFDSVSASSSESHSDIIEYDNEIKSGPIIGSGPGSDIDPVEVTEPNESKLSPSEGLKRRGSIHREIMRMYGYQNKMDYEDTKSVNISSVIMAFCNYNPRLSFTQFMVYLVDMLLDYQSTELSFISLCNIMKHPLFDMIIDFKQEKLEIRRKIFTDILEKNASKLAKYLYDLSPLKYNILDSYILECIQSLFTTQLTHDIVTKIWDLYFLNGELIIWKCSVSLLITIDEHLGIIWESMDINKVMNILQSIDKKMVNIDTESFINKINLIIVPGHIERFFNDHQ